MIRLQLSGTRKSSRDFRPLQSIQAECSGWLLWEARNPQGTPRRTSQKDTLRLHNFRWPANPRDEVGGKPTEPTAQQTAKQAAELCLPISGIHAFPRLNGSRETKLSAELLQVVQPTCKQLFVMLSFKKHF